MKFFLTKIMVIIAVLIPSLKNPMSLGLMLILQTILVIMYINMIYISSWFMMITFLMMIGGLLILFTYMSSIASNEKFKMKFNFSMTMIIMIMMWEELIFDNQLNDKLELMTINNINMSMVKIYNKKSMMLTIMLVIYLLLTMIVVSKIVKRHEGPLRFYKNYEQAATKK